MADSTIWTNLPQNRHALPLFPLKEVEAGLPINYHRL